LVDNRPEDGAGLVWKPLGSTTASRLRAEAPTVIDYPEPVTPSARAEPVPWVSPVSRATAVPAAASRPIPQEPPSTLHLRSGDTLDCRQVEISDEGVSFESPHHDLTRLPHELVSALDLRPGTTIGPAAQAKFERSLTLPRSQQTHPPTHLVHGMDGDCLRCRLLGLNSAELQVEVHGRTRAIPRQTVTRIQWLHPEGAEAPVEPVRATPGTTRVLAVLDNRLRVALAVDQVVGDLLLGHHDRLGTCRIDLARTRRLVTHPTGPINAEEPEFAGWQLRPALAPRPRVVASETKPALRVGQAAPEVTLELVGGEPLRLADRKGDILVLEFWASWCEPCLRVLPQAEGVVGEFPEGTVRLIAVNLEESAEVATQVLERLRVKTRIALDKTGTIAAQFGATELPQTVVIDRQGRVAKVLVGGGVEFRTELREVLRAISVGDAEGKK
jgi:peroxiredoxin